MESKVVQNEHNVNTLGGWVTCPDPIVVEIMAKAGFDWLCLDMQHGTISIDNVVPVLQAIGATNLPTLVRVPSSDPTIIGKVLDVGAAGIIVPLVETSDEAQRVVSSAFHYPIGKRSWGPIRATKAAGTSVNGREAPVIIAMIETRNGVEAISAISKVKGLDGIFVGPADLSLSMGERPSIGPLADRVNTAVNYVRAICRDVGLLSGIYCGSEERVKYWRDRNFEMLAAISDMQILSQGAQNMVHACGTNTANIYPAEESYH